MPANVPMSMAIKLCQDLSGQTIERIAVYFKVGHYSAITGTISRLNELMTADMVQLTRDQGLRKALVGSKD
jgi:hypothetical protein